MDDWQLQVISGHVVCESGLLISRKCQKIRNSILELSDPSKDKE